MTIALDGVVPPRDERCIHRLPMTSWQPPAAPGDPLLPKAGRWYPQGFIHGVANIFPQTITPMKVIEVDDQTLTVDCNHPLAGRQQEITTAIESVRSLDKERGGRCSAWLEDSLANGPGMQAIEQDRRPDFEESDARLRGDQEGDALFYAMPRMTGHIDRQASDHLAATLGRWLQPGWRILDLMAGYQSHLPPGSAAEVIGLGMNSEEMAANPALCRHLVHDLNVAPELPLPDNSFDAVVCNLSIEYLTDPREVLRQAARVLRPDGLLAVSFSDRWFPTKVTRLWLKLHEFERMGFVLDCLRDECTALATVTYRFWPRPADDRHARQLRYSDPLFVVSGRRR